MASSDIDKLNTNLSKLANSIKVTPVNAQRSKMVLVFIAIVCTLGVIYFFFYTQKEGDKFDSQRFRVLRLIDENLRNKENSYQDILSQLRKDLGALGISGSSGLDSTQKEGVIKELQSSRSKNGQIYRELKIVNSRQNVDESKFYLFDKILLSHSDSLSIYIKIESYLKSLVPPQIFENIIIFESDQSLTNTRVKFQNLENRIFPNLKLNESAAKNTFALDSTSLFTGNVTHIDISGVSYRLYIHTAKPKFISGEVNEVFPSANRDTNIEFICGLVRQTSYVSQSRRINIWWVIIISVIVIVLIVGLPILKIYLISETERLKSTDVVLTGMSVIVGTPLVLLTCMVLGEYIMYYTTEQKTGLENLAQEIDSQFTQEVKDILCEMSFLDNHSDNWKSQIDASDSSCTIQEINKSELLRHYPYFNEFFGMDSVGHQTFSLTNYQESGKKLISLTDRNYYTSLESGKLLNIEACDKNFEFSLESVTSWTTGEKELVIARSTFNQDFPDSKYIAMSTYPSSVVNPILLPGFQYAIIDKEGKTLFHSNLNRNNNENFLDELSDSNILKSAIFGNYQAFDQDIYWEERVRLHITPSKNLPYYIVTFYEMKYARSFISEIASICVIFILLSFVLVGLVVYVTTRQDRPDDFLEFKEFVFDWLRPKKESTRVYSLSIIFSLVLTVLFFLFASLVYRDLWLNGGNLVAVIVMMPTLLFISNYWIHNVYYEDNKLKRKILIQLIILIVYLGLFSPFIFHFYWTCGFVITWLVVLGTYVYLIKKFFAKHRHVAVYRILRQIVKVVRLENTWNKKVLSYRYYMFFWLFTSAVIPVFILVGYFKNVEEIIYNKYEILKTAMGIEEKYESIQQEFSNVTNTDFKLNKTIWHQYGQSSCPRKGYYADSIFVSLKTVQEPQTQNPDLIGLKYWETFLINLRPFYDESLTQSSAAIPLRSYDDRLRWDTNRYVARDKKRVTLDYQLSSKIGNESHLHIERYTDDGDEVQIFAGLPFSKRNFIRNPSLSVIILFLPLIFLFLIWRLIIFLSETIFSLKYGSYKQKNVSLQELEEADKRTIFICSSFRYKEKLSKDLSLDLVDYEKLQEIRWYTPVAIELEQFLMRLSIMSKGENKSDLANFIDLTFQSDLRIIICYKYPSVLLKDFNLENEHLTNKISNYLSGYDQIVVSESNLKLPVAETSTDPKAFECQKTYHQYFHNIWNTCTRGEQYILYDLAEDGFVNSKNNNSILYLINKGILKWQGQLKLFNEGFRNYILTNIKKNQGVRIEADMKRQGAWTVIRFILLGIITTLVVFIALGEPDFFSDFNTMLTLVASLVTLFPLIGSLFATEQKNQ